MFTKKKKSLYIYAVDTDENSILKDFARSYAEQTNSVIVPLVETRQDFFNLISNYFDKAKGVVVIDEYPYITTDRFGRLKNSAFQSYLQRSIDLKFKNQNFLLILTGSNVSLIESEINNKKSPLYGRNHFSLSLFRFTLKETCEIFKDFTDNINKARILSLVSTYPYYLSFVDFSKDYLTNMFELFYEEESPFSRYPESIITTNVVYSGYYSSIIKEISLGNYTYESLIKALKIESSTLSKYLNELIDLQTIKPRYKFLTSKGILYEINDPILAFYFRFIRNNADIMGLRFFTGS